MCLNTILFTDTEIGIPSKFHGHEVLLFLYFQPFKNVKTRQVGSFTSPQRLKQSKVTLGESKILGNEKGGREQKEPLIRWLEGMTWRKRPPSAL